MVVNVFIAYSDYVEVSTRFITLRWHLAFANALRFFQRFRFHTLVRVKPYHRDSPIRCFRCKTDKGLKVRISEVLKLYYYDRSVLWFSFCRRPTLTAASVRSIDSNQ